MTTLLDDLAAAVGAERVRARLIDRIARAGDASFYRLVPQAVVEPQSIPEIQALFAVSHARRIPLTFRAAGTSLSGQAITDGVLVDVSRHWRRAVVEDGGSRVRVQPGVIGGHVNRLLKPHGRRIGPDPASLNACMMGGILANNSSGMCCGVAHNAYHTLEALTFVLPGGTVVDTAAPDADGRFRAAEPDLAAGLLALRARLLEQPPLVERIRARYRMKNTTGYSICAFLDFERPVEIMRHLLIGSEGTLGFIAEGVLRTIPDPPLRHTALLLFGALRDACAAIAPLRAAGVATAELMDRASLRAAAQAEGMSRAAAGDSESSRPGVRQDGASQPNGVESIASALHALPPDGAALLVELQCATDASRTRARADFERLCADLRLAHPPLVARTSDGAAALWKVRQGLLPTVGAERPPGTSTIIEDVTFPLERLAAGVAELRALFERHGYADAIIFGHARDGNMHFVLAQSFNDAGAVRQYEAFMADVVELVAVRHGGALKSEHGTGRNMAPFVATEWGAEAYQVMRDLKALVDPRGLLNPGVIINADPRAHVRHLKTLPVVEAEVDRCIECGFCESHCPSRDLTLTPRGRIAVRRERARAGGTVEAAILDQEFQYDGQETCAADGMCATACPVGIDTGALIRRLRTESRSEGDERRAAWVARHLAWLEWMARVGLRLAHFAARRLGHGLLRELTTRRFPAWSAHMPLPAPRLPRTRAGDAVYLPTCLSRVLGPHPSEPRAPAQPDVLVALARRAGMELWIPGGIPGTCCGMPFSSKGYHRAHVETANATVEKLWRWSDGGRQTVVVDTSSCAYALRTCGPVLTEENRRRHAVMRILDAVAFAHDELLPRLRIVARRGKVALHPVCSLQKMGLDGKLRALAEACADSVEVPLSAGCCGFAGDRGLRYPELTAAATRAEAAEVAQASCDGHYASNRACELALTQATGEVYRSILFLLEKATRPMEEAHGESHRW